MTYHSSDPGHRTDTTVRPRDNTKSWMLGIVAALALLGIMFWAFSGDNANTARTGGDTNTGSVTRTAPTPAAPGAPATGTRP